MGIICSCLVSKSHVWLFCDPHGLQPARLLCPWNFPGKSTGVGCHFLLQVIFLTQGLNPYLLHWQADPLPLSHRGSPYIYIFFFFQILFYYSLLQDIEYSILNKLYSYTVNPCCLSILCIEVCICQSKTPNLSLPTLSFSFVNHTFVSYESVTVL